MTETTRVAFPLEWRTINTDERTVEGIAVPWGETSYLTPDPGGERFVAGSLTKSVRDRGSRLKLFVGHDHTHAVGAAVKLDARHPDGLWTQWRIFRTPYGDDALAEMAEGALDSLSVGFRTIRHRRGDDGAREVLEADVHEVSVAPIGAYDGARVLSIRTPATSAIPRWWETPAPTVTLTPVGPLRRY